jgi:conjugal transfer mating pair stabilization protein TraN
LKEEAQGFCLNGDCLPTQQTANSQIFNALSRLEILKQMQKQIAGTSIRIFKGENQACTTNFGGGFKDCCKAMKGFGLDLKLAKECTADEQALAAARKEGRCVYVGSYIKNRHLGINFSKAQTFCTFPTKLARIFQEEARKQLKMDWGSAENPDCRGFTLEELQQLDFSRMNLSEAYSDISERVKKSSEIMKTVMSSKQSDLKSQSADTLKKKYKETHEKAEKGESHEMVY